MEKENRPQSRKENIVIQEFEGEVLIYDLDRNKAFCLNQTSALVWQACDGRRTIAQIKAWLGQQLESQINEEIVWLALDQLSRENLIENKTEFESRFKGISRREVIKKVGLASAVALPVVASLVAPLAAHAVSGCPIMACTCPFLTGVGMTCTTPTCAPTAMCGCQVSANAPGANPNPGVCN